MANMICRRCGSKSLIADRSLAGRIVCSKCGGEAVSSSSVYFSRNIIYVFKNNKPLLFLISLVLVIFLIVAI